MLTNIKSNFLPKEEFFDEFNFLLYFIKIMFLSHVYQAFRTLCNPK